MFENENPQIVWNPRKPNTNQFFGNQKAQEDFSRVDLKRNIPQSLFWNWFFNELHHFWRRFGWPWGFPNSQIYETWSHHWFWKANCFKSVFEFTCFFGLNYFHITFGGVWKCLGAPRSIIVMYSFVRYCLRQLWSRKWHQTMNYWSHFWFLTPFSKFCHRMWKLFFDDNPWFSQAFPFCWGATLEKRNGSLQNTVRIDNNQGFDFLNSTENWEIILQIRFQATGSNFKRILKIKFWPLTVQ